MTGINDDLGARDTAGRGAPPGGLPVPAPEEVRAARIYLTSRHATGLDELLWEERKRPMPDGAAVNAVIAASGRARRGVGDAPSPMDVAAALVLLSALRSNLDLAEARLLDTARVTGLGIEQLAAVLGVSVAEAEERRGRLEPLLDECAALPSTALPSTAWPAKSKAADQPTGQTSRPWT
ncbi:hypothetical protein [Actinomadura decatromicini]|uniref:Uncharacterized protein n=1 Tax=Actinomadura decatromicini TaxID=2604572 RepID=A0A5D3FT24_9ACTN|nr:hypothetical protein [Actinomadura decatromicini]TYK51066.1 hypothetical protein FXF68_11490 [Actinomadura decatromicini]